MTHKTRVMIVDDSAIIRGLLSRALENCEDIEVIGSVFNGEAAIHQLSHIAPDIILLDVEMPGMDGIAALPQLVRMSPQSRIIMVSMLTQHNAEITLRALELGASDYIAKPSARGDSGETGQFYHELIAKIRALAGSTATKASSGTDKAAVYPSGSIRAVAIGCSTGGPGALKTVFSGLAAQFPEVPLYVTQHMPPAFVTVLARHIAQYCGHDCFEGRTGDIVQAGAVYLAPGNTHMIPERNGDNVIIRLSHDAPVNFCRPSIDCMLQGLARVYGRNLLTVILTGMGSDGVAGARAVAEAGGTVVVQDAETSVVWGMPQAIVDNKLCSAVLPLEAIAPYIIRSCNARGRI